MGLNLASYKLEYDRQTHETTITQRQHLSMERAGQGTQYEKNKDIFSGIIITID